jgi:NAD(P)-dependent dehydrogenase (short-subunit alcohol dehydrogenase family)
MKTAVVTGGTGGIGKAVASAMARKQFHVIIHGRDPHKAEQAVQEIKINSGNTNVEYITADISTLHGMKKLADAIKSKTDVVHALILSTGVILPNRVVTADGLEAGFVIQYLSRFAITQLLKNELSKGKARIVMVVAPVIKGAKIHFEDITLEKDFTMLRAMAQEMFANHLFVQEFAKRHAANDVVINMANPGIIDTGIAKHLAFPLRWGLKLIGTKPEKAAYNLAFLASDEGVNFSGYFLKKPGKPEVKEKANHDPAAAEKLWEKSMELINPIL